MEKIITITIVLLILRVNCGNSLSFLLITQEGQSNVKLWLENVLGKENTLKSIVVYEEEEDEIKVCEIIDGVQIIVDVTYYRNEFVNNVTNNLNIPYVKIDVSIGPILQFLDALLDIRNCTDVAIIFDKYFYVDQALYQWIDTPRLRLVISDKLDAISAKRLNEVRPTPTNYVIVSSTDNISAILKVAIKENLLWKPERWLLVFTDYNYDNFDKSLLENRTLLMLKMDRFSCCEIIADESCKCPINFNQQRTFFEVLIREILQIFNEHILQKYDFSKSYNCNVDNEDLTIKNEIEKDIRNNLPAKYKALTIVDDVMKIKLSGIVQTINGFSENVNIANYKSLIGLSLEKEVPPIRRFYRIGTTTSVPWSYEEVDPLTGTKYWTGYCVDLAKKLAEIMDFDYEIISPTNGTFGKKKSNGIWDGVVGDLARGETDIAIAALTMTADREEVVDFVAPYYEQSGISIVMRKPVRKTSLFKFMTVLKLEVWLSIVAALVVTGFMVWFLDKYSPYSARNNKVAYPYPCREFTLKESFWFALTSFTPQGGGEAPKALSGRTLVAAYWLFVVLMLATFTANLAAFLTVERMQTPVQSLEQLAKQSRINYTVVESSDTHKYFINMKFAEDTLYRMWKELTLNASTDDTRYRVWDYPIREQYGHILLAINDSMPLPKAVDGFRKVNEQLDADFAFIHDSSEIKYEISRNCNLTEIGEVFAEKPYAVAIQQGSHLQDEISKTILDLQKERFFEYLQSKYWNHSAKGDCENADDTEGITLESLGGVFIATLFGLALAMITLAFEVIYYKKRKIMPKETKKKQIGKQEKQVNTISTRQITIGSQFKPVKDYNATRISPVVLYPKARARLPRIN